MPKLLCSPGDPEWLELRRSGITASDLPVIMGLVPWDSPWALYHRKRGTLPEVEQSDRMRLGSWLESSIQSEWWLSHGGDLSMTGPGLYANDDRSWQLATPDAVLDGAVLECKTSATRDGWGWGDDPTCSCSSEEAKNLIPAYVRAQVLWQMDTLQVATGHVAVVFLPSGEFRSYMLSHDHGGGREMPRSGICDLCDDIRIMRDKALEFYRRVTGELPAPPVDHLTVTTKALQEVYAGLDDTLQAELDPDLYDAWVTARAIATVADRDAKLLTNQLREAMGKAGVGAINSEPVVRRTVSKRAGYEVAPGVQDKLTKIKPKEDA